MQKYFYFSYYAKSLALDLLSRYENHISSTLLFDKIWGYRPFWDTLYLFTGLHCASYFGIHEIMAALIDTQGCNINQGDCKGVTPLILAAHRGNQEAVMLLLTQDDIDPNKPDNNGKTPLWGAPATGTRGS